MRARLNVRDRSLRSRACGQKKHAPPVHPWWGAKSGRDRGTSAQLGVLDVGTLPLHMAEQPGRGVPKRPAGDHVVDLTMLEQELGGLEPLGQVLADRLLDH